MSIGRRLDSVLKSNRLAVGQMALLITCSLSLALGLSYLYRGVSYLFGWELWVAAGLVHSLGVFGSLPLYQYLWRWPEQGERFKSFLPAVTIVVVTTGAALISRILGEATSLDSNGLRIWLSILWIPLAEEIFFRGLVSPRLRLMAGNLWGSYFSAVIFALVHTNFTWSGIVGWEFGVPIGPFLLALVCEGLVLRFTSIWPAIGFHAACNGTVWIFSNLDGRWFQWLSGFYL